MEFLIALELALARALLYYYCIALLMVSSLMLKFVFDNLRSIEARESVSTILLDPIIYDLRHLNTPHPLPKMHMKTTL